MSDRQCRAGDRPASAGALARAEQVVALLHRYLAGLLPAVTPRVHRVVALEEPVDDVHGSVLIASRVACLDLDEKGWLELLDRALPALQDVQLAAFDVDLDEVKPGDTGPGYQGIHGVDRHRHLLVAHELDVGPESGRLARQEGPARYGHATSERDAHRARTRLGVEGDGVGSQVLQALDSEDPPPHRVRELQRLDAVHMAR